MANRRFIDFPIAASVGDNDIVLIWQDGLNKQTTKATLFAGSPNSLAGLTDVDISALTNGQILQYNSTTSKWENVDRTDIDLDQLGDVTIVSPTNGQVLVYNSSTSKWENSSAGFVPYTGAVTTVNLGAQSILAGSFVKAGGTSAQFLKADGSVDSTAYGTGSVTSVALTMPTAFSVANSPITTAGTLAVTGAGTVGQYIRGDGSLATFPALTGFVPYTGATADVNLGTHDLTAERGTFQNNGSSDTLTVNHTSGSGYGIIVTKGGNNEALYVSKTSGSGNAMTVIGGRTSLVDLALSSVTNTAGDFLTLSGGVVHKRTAAEVRTDIGAGTVTSVAALTLGTSGTDLSSTVANGTTTPVITLNVPTASATNRGALSSADWSTFNNKQNALTNPVTGTGSAGQVAYWSSGSAITGESNLFWDATNDRLGIGGLSNSYKLQITNSAALGITISTVGSDSGNPHIQMVNGSIDTTIAATSNGLELTAYSSHSLLLKTANVERFRITTNGRVLIGTPPPSESTFQLDVSGTGRFSSDLTANSFIKSGGTSAQFLKADGSVDSTTYVPVGRTITINGTTQDLSANRTYNVGTVTSVTASTPLFSSGGATPNITIQQASGSENGFLSSTDWTTFNNKQNALTNPVTGTGASGRVAFWNGTNTITSDSDLLFSGTTLTLLAGNVEIAAGNGLILFNPATTNYFQLYTNSANELNFGFGGTNPRMTVTSSGRLLIGNSPPAESTFTLDVNGGARFTNSTRVDGSFVITQTNTPQQSILLNDIATNGNTLGLLSFGGRWNSTTYANGSQIRATAVGTWSSTNYGTNLAFGTVAENSTTLNTRMTITSGGNVGIGTSSPSFGLDLLSNNSARFKGSGSSMTFNLDNSSSSGGGGIYFRQNGTIGGGIGISGWWLGDTSNDLLLVSGTDRNIRFLTNDVSPAKMTITSGGNVLIGTTTNGASKLRIVGLPTSAAGLSSGDVYNLAGVLMIA
jgi:hypothetical protein